MTKDAKYMRTLRVNRLAREECTRCGSKLTKEEKAQYVQCDTCRQYREDYKRRTHA